MICCFMTKVQWVQVTLKDGAKDADSRRADQANSAM